jgi:AGZA family xanthine/uracil permease-like MFS transporter
LTVATGRFTLTPASKSNSHATAKIVTQSRYRWAAPGDVNAFFGLMLDNVADVLLMVGLMAGVFGFPTNFAWRYMIPGTAIGVLVGDLLFFVLAVQLARRTGRSDVTAMPLGLDTPSTFGMVFFVLGPAYKRALNDFGGDVDAAALHTWHLGICAIFASGVLKLICAFGSNWIRATIPRAGLLGSLAAIAAVVISFLPLLEVFHSPIVGLVSLAIILTTLIAKVKLPFNIPGALGALIVGGTMYWLMEFGGALAGSPSHAWTDFGPQWEAASAGLLPREWLSVFSFQWTSAFQESLRYLPIVIPFALATVVGGIDCTESAAAVGDEYDTGQVIGVEAIATLAAALCGGVIQTTPYIGHPAYKAMGGRAAYTLATALFIGGAGILGYFGFLYLIIPKPTVFPILVFVGLEITAQSFYATPKRHYTAVGLSLVPALAALVSITAGSFGVTEQSVPPHAMTDYISVRMLYNGFIVISLIWASALAMLIDHRLYRAAIFFAMAAVFTLFGVMHSPLPSGAMYVPWDLGSDPTGKVDYNVTLAPIMFRWALGYGLVAVLLGIWGMWTPAPPPGKLDAE